MSRKKILVTFFHIIQSGHEHVFVHTYMFMYTCERSLFTSTSARGARNVRFERYVHTRKSERCPLADYRNGMSSYCDILFRIMSIPSSRAPVILSFKSNAVLSVTAVSATACVHVSHIFPSKVLG